MRESFGGNRGFAWQAFTFCLLIQFGCSGEGRPSSGTAPSTEPFVLTSRADSTLLADTYAAQAERASGERAIELLTAAARVRERLFRMERRKSDALEAVEHYRMAGKQGDCLSALRSVALSAEAESDPGIVGRDLNTREADPILNKCSNTMLALRSVVGAAVPRKESTATSISPSPESESDRDTSAIVTPRLPDGRQDGKVQLTRVERYAGKDAARIVVSLSEPTTYRANLVRAEGRLGGSELNVDIEHASTVGDASYAVGGLVKRVRVLKQGDGVRLVLELEESADRRVFYMPEPFRIVVDVARSSLVQAQLPINQRIIERVVIDPGHGGSDPGAIGPSGLREKDVTLDIAHRAGPLIARELGLSTLLTRDTDVYVALDERTARANAFRADLFVSIHCNAAEHSGSDGVFTFVLDDSTDSSASRVAALENAASQAAAKELARSLAPARDEGVLSRSLHFAELLQRSAGASLSKDYGKIPHQGVRRAGFYVLAGAHMPAVLYEVTFISNPDGEVRLNTADYRQRLADSIVNAVRAYRDGI